MPVSGINTGIDVSAVVFDPNTNQAISFGIITRFNRKTMTAKLTCDPLDSPPIFATVPKGWQGTFMCDRNSAACDTFFAAREAAYFNGSNILNGYIQETIREVTSYTQFMYNGTDFDFTDAGDVSQDAFIKLTISWRASTRTQTYPNVS